MNLGPWPELLRSRDMWSLIKICQFILISNNIRGRSYLWSFYLEKRSRSDHIRPPGCELKSRSKNWSWYFGQGTNSLYPPLPLLLPLGPRAKPLVTSAPLPLCYLLGGARTLALGPNFLCHLPLSLPAASWVAQELWPKGQTSCAINNAGFSYGLRPSGSTRRHSGLQILNSPRWGVIISHYYFKNEVSLWDRRVNLAILSCQRPE